MSEDAFDKRARARELASEFAEQGDSLGWFDALYKESAGDLEKIPWADLAPNQYFRAWAESSNLKGNGRGALVVGCGLGDDAVYLDELGFNVTAFDISPTAIEWAKRLHSDRTIQFEVADLFAPPFTWTAEQAGGLGSGGGFEFVLEVYTIQPLPLEIRPKVIDAISSFVAPGGELVVVTRGRDDDVEPETMPWPLSRRDLSRFPENGFEQLDFQAMAADVEDEPDPRWVIHYRRH